MHGFSVDLYNCMPVLTHLGQRFTQSQVHVEWHNKHACPDSAYMG